MKIAGKIYFAIMMAFLYLPIFFLIFYSFNSAGNMTHFKGFTFDHYMSVFQNKRLIVIIVNTIAIALLAASISTIIGICGAIGIYYMRNKKLKVGLLTLNNILMVSSDVVIGSSFLLLFTVIGHYTGMGLGFWSVLISHIAFCVPIVVLLVLPKLYDMNKSIVDAARDLGASSFQTLVKVIIPHILPGAIGGFFMALTYSLDDFTVSFFVTGSGFSVLSVEVYSMARKGITMEINAISTLLFMLVMILILGYYAIKKGQQKRVQKRGEVMR
ncbi:ABC transporter permease [Mammaliicoccus stepanovicii]|uniref:PotC n=1 Tax=Mammaliicoccus stepanovicii TaxID=643214 RepID=A0A239ZPQ9_9STAP|nr:ABC transporter permease [Mammaliicoccus stepanovicii]PNZ79192.1 spermidine/putrescine ABC transporter permease PotC [Mammaliicoccus stepanovicii]GGI41455.1 spermidine/putrescine ABC transporter permease [Mammaliicoccus stepanovicii]SNV72566.1 PotC [Mammaliicoccus stepanovicii]